MSQASLADAKARVAPSQPPLGTSQSWGGGGGRAKALLGRSQANVPRTLKPPGLDCPMAQYPHEVGSLADNLIGQAGLGYVPRSKPCPTWPIKPPGHTPKPLWRSATWDLQLCPAALDTPYWPWTWSSRIRAFLFSGPGHTNCLLGA